MRPFQNISFIVVIHIKQLSVTSTKPLPFNWFTDWLLPSPQVHNTETLKTLTVCKHRHPCTGVSVVLSSLSLLPHVLFPSVKKFHWNWTGVYKASMQFLWKCYVPPFVSTVFLCKLFTNGHLQRCQAAHIWFFFLFHQ